MTGETLAAGIQDAYMLGADEAVVLQAQKQFEDDSGKGESGNNLIHFQADSRSISYYFLRIEYVCYMYYFLDFCQSGRKFLRYNITVG